MASEVNGYNSGVEFLKNYLSEAGISAESAEEDLLDIFQLAVENKEEGDQDITITYGDFEAALVSYYSESSGQSDTLEGIWNKVIEEDENKNFLTQFAGADGDEGNISFDDIKAAYGMDNDERVLLDDEGNFYVNVEIYTGDHSSNGCLYDIIDNSYDFEAIKKAYEEAGMTYSYNDARDLLLSEIVNVNNISDPNLIYAGSTVILPCIDNVISSYIEETKTEETETEGTETEETEGTEGIETEETEETETEGTETNRTQEISNFEDKINEFLDKCSDYPSLITNNGETLPEQLEELLDDILENSDINSEDKVGLLETIATQSSYADNVLEKVSESDKIETEDKIRLLKTVSSLDGLVSTKAITMLSESTDIEIDDKISLLTDIATESNGAKADNVSAALRGVITSIGNADTNYSVSDIVKFADLYEELNGETISDYYKEYCGENSNSQEAQNYINAILSLYENASDDEIKTLDEKFDTASTIQYLLKDGLINNNIETDMLTKYFGYIVNESTIESKEGGSDLTSTYGTIDNKEELLWLLKYVKEGLNDNEITVAEAQYLLEASMTKNGELNLEKLTSMFKNLSSSYQEIYLPTLVEILEYTG